jgi:hypothetical protein
VKERKGERDIWDDEMGMGQEVIAWQRGDA